MTAPPGAAPRAAWETLPVTPLLGVTDGERAILYINTPGGFGSAATTSSTTWASTTLVNSGIYRIVTRLPDHLGVSAGRRQMSTSCVSAMNKRIRDVNLEVPKARFQRPMVEVAREVRRVEEEG